MSPVPPASLTTNPGLVPGFLLRAFRFGTLLPAPRKDLSGVADSAHVRALRCLARGLAPKGWLEAEGAAALLSGRAADCPESGFKLPITELFWDNVPLIFDAFFVQPSHQF